MNDEGIEDDRIRLIFTCCHPALAPESRVALTLREVCGLTNEEISHAFLIPPSTLAQRIVRAKAKIREARIPYQVPSPAELPNRLVYLDEKRLDEVPDSECLAYVAEIGKSGHCIASEALRSVETATTVRVRNGKASVTDGPFAETKKQLAGFYLVEAKALNEAIQLAPGIPPASVGSIEVRPIRPIRETAGSK